MFRRSQRLLHLDRILQRADILHRRQATLALRIVSREVTLGLRLDPVQIGRIPARDRRDDDLRELIGVPLPQERDQRFGKLRTGLEVDAVLGRGLDPALPPVDGGDGRGQLAAGRQPRLHDLGGQALRLFRAVGGRGHGHEVGHGGQSSSFPRGGYGRRALR